MTNACTLLALSGSLRARSANPDTLRAAAMLAPEWATVTLYSSLAALPHFNPDLDRRVERATDDRERILRETQRYEYRTGRAETDTLDVSVSAFASRRALRQLRRHDSDGRVRPRCVPG